MLEALAGLHRALLPGLTREELLPEIAVRACRLVDGADAAGLIRTAPDVATLAVTDPALAPLPDGLDEGPWLDAATRSPGVVRVEAVDREERWPAGTARARELGLSSAVFVRLPDGFTHEVIVLGVYATTGVLEAGAERTARLFAAVAGIALGGVRREDQLRTALGTRDLIGQAKGMLMERYDLTADQSFGVLRQASMDTNTPLRDVAHRVTEREDAELSRESAG